MDDLIMNTIMDAVKYYRGNDLNSHIDAIHFNGGFFSGANEPIMHDFVCSLDQYNCLLSQLKDNFGKSSLKHLHIWQEGIKPHPKPVFTQAMADNNILPLAGMEFLVGNEVESDSRTIDFKNKVVKVIGLSKLDDDTVITFSHPTIGIGCGVFFDSWVKPLTPPIELINGRAYQFKLNGQLIGFYRENRKSFFTELHHGNKICGSAEPSDIQLLKVNNHD